MVGRHLQLLTLINRLTPGQSGFISIIYLWLYAFFMIEMACWIRGCTTKGGKKDSSRKKNLFTACTEKMFNNWCDNGIAARGINEFSKKSCICELHFQKDNILREDIFYMADGAIITVQRKVPKLKDAVPSIFPSEIISYYRLNL